MSSLPHWPDELKASDALDRLNRLAATIGRNFPRWVAQRLEAAAFDRVCDRLGSFDPERGKFWPWCRRVLATFAHDLLREERRGRKKQAGMIARLMARAGEDVSLAGALLPTYLGRTRHLNEL